MNQQETFFSSLECQVVVCPPQILHREDLLQGKHSLRAAGQGTNIAHKRRILMVQFRNCRPDSVRILPDIPLFLTELSPADI